MSEGPAQLMLDAVLVAKDLPSAVTAAMAACRGLPGFSAMTGWRVGERGRARNDSPPLDAPAVEIVFAAEAEDGIVVRGDGADAYTFALRWTDVGREAEALAGLTACVHALAATRMVRQAVVQRLVGGHCLPVLPLVGDATHVLACQPAAVAAAYGDPAAFAAAWDAVETRGEVMVFSRALGAVRNPDFLRAVLPGHMALTRLSRPEDVILYAPRFADGEYDVLDAGEPTLSGAGYRAHQQVYEFSGHLAPGAELRCIDLFTAWKIARDRRLPSGETVREVRAVFMDEVQAARAAPLLRAAGVVVGWENPAGDLQFVP